MEYGNCPVDCAYCVIRQVENRKSLWDAAPKAMAVNKAVTIVNSRIPDVSILEGDIVSYNGVSDPFWNRHESDLLWFLREIAPVARIVTCVTKIPPSEKIWDILETVDNFRLVVSVTGLDKLEKIPTTKRVEILKEAKKRNIPAFPVVHPYIPGMSDLNFLRDVPGDVCDVKGLRYDRRMDSWMPPTVVEWHRMYEGMEAPVESPNTHGKKMVSLKKWYDDGDTKNVSRERAERLVSKVFKAAHITSSDSNDAVLEASVRRRK